MKFGVFIPTFADSPENGNPGFAPAYSNIYWKETTRYAVTKILSRVKSEG